MVFVSNSPTLQNISVWIAIGLFACIVLMHMVENNNHKRHNKYIKRK